MFELFLCWQEGRISRQVSCQPQLAHKRISWSLSQLLDLQLACLLIHAGAGCFFFFLSFSTTFLVYCLLPCSYGAEFFQSLLCLDHKSALCIKNKIIQ